MAEISEFFASQGVNPFLAGLVIGALLCAVVRVGVAVSSDRGSDFLSHRVSVSVSEKTLSPEVSATVLQSLADGNRDEALQALQSYSDLSPEASSRLIEALESAGLSRTA